MQDPLSVVGSEVVRDKVIHAISECVVGSRIESTVLSKMTELHAAIAPGWILFTRLRQVLKPDVS